MSGPIELSVVVPAYNEAIRLPESLVAVKTYLEAQDRSFELILVDDGSSDGTLAAIEREAERHAYVVAVGLERNRGKGYAVAAGVARSQGRLVLISDADFSAPIEELAKLESAIERGADIAVGSRAKKGKVILISQPLHRVLMGKVFNLIVQALILPGIWDTQCGFKLFKGDQARTIFAQLTTDGFAFDVEALARARRLGLELVEVPVRWQHSAPTTVSPFRHSANTLKEVLSLRIRFWKGDVPDPGVGRREWR